MPWRECKPMDERLRFMAHLLEGEKMAVACRQCGFSRVTGYKIYSRYKECGLDALYDRIPLCAAIAEQGQHTEAHLVPRREGRISNHQPV